MPWAVFKNGKRVSKDYDYKEQAIIHAIEAKLYYTGHYYRRKGIVALPLDGVEIKPTESRPDEQA